MPQYRHLTTSRFGIAIVMNLISHSHAYSLYARALQDKVSLICCSNERPERDEARQKYVDRRYSMINGDGTPWQSRTSTSPPQVPSSSELQFDTARVVEYFYISEDRRLNDNAVWKIPLASIDEPRNPELDLPWISDHWYPIMPPLLLYEHLTGSPVIETNSWMLAPEEWKDSDLELWMVLGMPSRNLTRYRAVYEIYQQPSLFHTYCISKSVMKEVVDILDKILFRGISREEMKSFLHNKAEQFNDFLQYPYVFPKSLC